MAVRALALLLVVLPVAAASAQPVGWPDAVAELGAERTRAIFCAARARSLDTATADRLGTAYTEAKAEIDAVIAGLSAALAQRGEPADLGSLEQRMATAATLRQSFCQAVIGHAPVAPGERGVLADVLGAFVKPGVEAVVELWKWRGEQDTLRRETIRAQLEATRWPAFSDVPPAR
jgi:hypothetical protein